MEFIKVEKDIWKLQDGSIFEGSANELPKSNASKIAKAGMEYKKEYLEGQGWGAKKKEEAKKIIDCFIPKVINKIKQHFGVEE